jgi:hypothetical protein
MAARIDYADESEDLVTLSGGAEAVIDVTLTCHKGGKRPG